MTRAQCKVYAIRLLKGESIPIFKEKIVNLTINTFVRQIKHLRTKRKPRRLR